MPHVQTYLLGCGLGKGAFAREVLTQLLNLRSLTNVASVLGGDALRHALTPELFKWIADHPSNHYYLTPNEKEYLHLSLLSDLETLPSHVCILRKGEVV